MSPKRAAQCHTLFVAVQTATLQSMEDVTRCRLPSCAKDTECTGAVCSSKSATGDIDHTKESSVRGFAPSGSVSPAGAICHILAVVSLDALARWNASVDGPCDEKARERIQSRCPSTIVTGVRVCCGMVSA